MINVRNMPHGTVENIFNDVHALLRSPKFRSVPKILLNPRNRRVIGPYNSDLNHAWYVIGESEARAKQYDGAIRSFQKAHKHDRQDWMALWAIGDCYDEMKLPRMALRYYARALKLAPKNGALRYNLANALIDLRQYGEAIRQLRKITSEDVELRRKVKKNLELARVRGSKA
jgi:tetratricopeptide (TPR) repeat protein